MFISMGNKKIKHKIIWFLADLNSFSERKLYIFEISETKKVVVLCETDKLKELKFIQKFKGKPALKLLEREKIRLLYTSDDIKIKKGKPFGWTYGENIEIHNCKGEVIKIKQNRCDYFGQKETIKII